MRECPAYRCLVPSDMSLDGHRDYHQRVLNRYRRNRRIHASVGIGLLAGALLCAFLLSEGYVIGIVFAAVFWVLAFIPLIEQDLDGEQLAVAYLTERWVNQHLPEGGRLREA